jgi:hypothetical protein
MVSAAPGFVQRGKQETHGKIPITPGEVWLPTVIIGDEILERSPGKKVGLIDFLVFYDIINFHEVKENFLI